MRNGRSVGKVSDVESADVASSSIDFGADGGAVKKSTAKWEWRRSASSGLKASVIDIVEFGLITRIDIRGVPRRSRCTSCVGEMCLSVVSSAMLGEFRTVTDYDLHRMNVVLILAYHMRPASIDLSIRCVIAFAEYPFAAFPGEKRKP